MHFTTKQTFLLLSWCAFLFVSGCQGNGSSAGTNPAGDGTVTKEEAGAASLHLLESSSSLLAQSIADELGRPGDSPLASLAIACPAGLPSSTLCEEGSVALDFQTCSLNRIGADDFFLSKLTGQFLSCTRDGLQTSGELSADAELKLPVGCILGSEFSPCQPVLARFSQIAGLLNITDESGQSWVMNVLSGFFTADWTTDGSGLFHAHLTEGELDLQAIGGGRFRCLIHEGESHCVPDADGDGITDAADNCPNTANQDQQDLDGDEIGDVCDDANVPCSVPPVCGGTAEDVCQSFRDACPVVDGRLKDHGEALFCINSACKVFIADIVSPDCSTDEPLPPGQQFCYPGQECAGDIDCFDYETCLEGCCLNTDYAEYLLSDFDQDGVRELDDNCPGDPDFHTGLNPTQGDCDKDGVGDACDNCPVDSNPMQEDSENPEFAGDGIGDVCDPDDDDDGIPDAVDLCPHNKIRSTVDNDGDGAPDICDNCPSVPNADQADTDYGDFGDEIGDACDSCPTIPDFRNDTDGDGIDDACDPDLDGDDVANEIDNCPYTPNPDQADCDGNFAGDACDAPINTDGDSFSDCDDQCPLFPSDDTTDTTPLNGIWDVCEADEDSDTLDNASDNCPFAVNVDQSNGDGDLPGDACDNCPVDFNPDQADFDHDDVGDVCDPDFDGDGFENFSDNCPYTPNPDQADSNGNGRGDACDSTKPSDPTPAEGASGPATVPAP